MYPEEPHSRHKGDFNGQMLPWARYHDSSIFLDCRGEAKPQVDTDDEETQEESASEVAEEPPVKRRRGRPGKSVKRRRAHSVGSAEESSDDNEIR